MKDIWSESDEDGTVRFAVVQTYGDTTHTFVERGNYRGKFLPGYRDVPPAQDVLLDMLPVVGANIVDHCVGNQPDLHMEEAGRSGNSDSQKNKIH